MIQILSVNRALASDVHINGRRVRSAIESARWKVRWPCGAWGWKATSRPTSRCTAA